MSNLGLHTTIPSLLLKETEFEYAEFNMFCSCSSVLNETLLLAVDSAEKANLYKI